MRFPIVQPIDDSKVRGGQAAHDCIETYRTGGRRLDRKRTAVGLRRPGDGTGVVALELQIVTVTFTPRGSVPPPVLIRG